MSKIPEKEKNVNLKNIPLVEKKGNKKFIKVNKEAIKINDGVIEKGKIYEKDGFKYTIDTDTIYRSKTYFIAGMGKIHGDLWITPRYYEVAIFGNVPLNDVFINPERCDENPAMHGGFGSNWRNIKEPFLSIMEDIADDHWKSTYLIWHEPYEYGQKGVQTRLLLDITEFDKSNTSSDVLASLTYENTFDFSESEAELLFVLLKNRTDLVKKSKWIKESPLVDRLTNELPYLYRDTYKEIKEFEFSYTEAKEFLGFLREVDESHEFYGLYTKHFGLDAFQIKEIVDNLHGLFFGVEKDWKFESYHSIPNITPRYELTDMEFHVIIKFASEKLKEPLITKDLRLLKINRNLSSLAWDTSSGLSKFINECKTETQFKLERLISRFNFRLDKLWKDDREFKIEKILKRK